MTETTIVLRIEPSPALLTAFETLALAVAKFSAGALVERPAPVIPPPAAADMVKAPMLPVTGCIDDQINATRDQYRQIAQRARKALDETPRSFEAGSGRVVVWSEERRDLLRALRKEGIGFDTILAKLNELEGQKIQSVGAVDQKYKILVKQGFIPRSEMLGTGFFASRGRGKKPQGPQADSGAPEIPKPPAGEAAPPVAEKPAADVSPSGGESALAVALREAIATKAAGEAMDRPHAALEKTMARLPQAAPPAPKPKADSRPVEASMEQIRHWAGQRGLATANSALNMKAINETRLRLGLSEFVVKPQTRSQAAA